MHRIIVLNRHAPIAGILRLDSRESASSTAAFRPLYILFILSIHVP